jgi:predicted transposase/invertase (TIGR01784 family)
MMVADTQEGKSNVLDIRARISGTRFNVEVQLQNKGNMDKRSFYYGGRELVDSLKKGDKYEDLPNIVTINILDFNYFDGWDNFHSTMHMSEDDHPNFKLDFFEMNFLEVLKLINPDLDNPIHQWVMFLKRGTPEEYIKKLMDMNTAIRSAQKRIDFILQDEKSRSLYLLNEKSRMDYNSSISHAERKGEKRGREEERREIIQGLMSKKGLSVQEIAELISLTPQEVSKLII